jgi:transcriptional regulator with XRE-family HTH domain
MTTEYGQRLKKARKHAGYTQVQLDEKTKIAQSTISTAEREGSGSNDALYADVCKVNALWLSTGYGEMLPAVSQSEITKGSKHDATPSAARFEEILRVLAVALAQADHSDRNAAKAYLVDLCDRPEDVDTFAAKLNRLLTPLPLQANGKQH